MKHRMRLETRTRGNVRVLELEGSFVLGSGDSELRETLDQLLEEGTARIVINVKHVHILDSAALGEMIAGTCKAHDKRGAVKIAAPPPRLREVLGRFPENFEVFETEEDAVAAFR